MYDRGGDINAEDATTEKHTVRDKAAKAAGGAATAQPGVGWSCCEALSARPWRQGTPRPSPARASRSLARRTRRSPRRCG